MRSAQGESRYYPVSCLFLPIGDLRLEPPDRNVRYGEYTGDYYRMVSIDEDDLVTTFVLEEVVYQGGTRQQFRRP